MSHSLDIEFIDPFGSFRAKNLQDQGPLYFPLANEAGLLSAITPDLHGDIKCDQHSFLTPPVSIDDLHLSRAARNFWLSFLPSRKSNVPWSVSGNSVWQKSKGDESATVEAGILWHKLIRTSARLGVQSTVLSFVPSQAGTFEVMSVEIKNISRKSIEFVATSAIPLFGRSADNLRDHRHVTSLLHRLRKNPFGIELTPTMSFNERGHLINTTTYFVVGVGPEGKPPRGLFPTLTSFIGEGGSLDSPRSLIENKIPDITVLDEHNGKEAIGALQFASVRLKPGQSAQFTLLLGIQKEPGSIEKFVKEFAGPKNVKHHFEATKKFWQEKNSALQFKTGDTLFNQWIQWVQVQPALRRIFGCSFLPDFDYGRGGRGWRDLWQDCLALLLADAGEVRDDLLHNFGGVRIDGSNATIIGRKQEFIADRNNIVRTWMDHGVWPFFTTLLYLNQTGDWGALLEKGPYFQDSFTHRGRKISSTELEKISKDQKLLTKDGKIYEGTVLEHILVQTLVPFFNVGEHNIMRLEDADWNDGLDMAHKRGESVAFTAMYAGNLHLLVDLIHKAGERAHWTGVTIAKELLLLLDQIQSGVDYNRVEEKKACLQNYFDVVSQGLSGEVVSISLGDLASDLEKKFHWIQSHLNRQEWIHKGDDGWFNGYYDNRGKRVEGLQPDGSCRMTLAGQVYPVMAGIADSDKIKNVLQSVNRYLLDKKLGGIRLNTNFGEIQPDLGRAFSFAYGEKENGAIFSHMVVMYAYALYHRGFVNEGHVALNSLYQLASRTDQSGIYPGLPEYFNNEGRGRYAYLTGSASWYILTLLTQVFGVRGETGDLVLAPKLVLSQFGKNKTVSVEAPFAGVRLRVTYKNPKQVSYDNMRIAEVRSSQGIVPVGRRSDKEIVISRDLLKGRTEWNLDVLLEPMEAQRSV